MQRIVPVFAVLTLLACSGCLSREIEITSTPEGARVFVSQVEVGRTPVTVPFDWGGDRTILLLHEEGEVRYEPVRIVHDSEQFFLDTFPFDVLADLAPFPIEDRSTIHVDLVPTPKQDEPPSDARIEALLERAAVLRERARIAQEQGPPPAPPYLPPLSPPSALDDDGS
ncbi:MAG TPA: PEGA domain-containing protein [Planctomycetes bacterium]|nr:PEGA domain-containing protein [Planctomycetota bacterium]